MPPRPASGRAPSLLLALALLAGCRAELPEVRLESEHFRLRRDYGGFCEGTATFLEAHYAALADYLGVALDPGAKIDVVVFPYADALVGSGYCGDVGDLAIEGCASGTDVFALVPYHPHELVHAYASLLGAPPFFFQEGLAQVLGCDEVVRPVLPARPGDLGPWLTTEGFRGLPPDELEAAYPVAGELTRYLLDRFGREAYLAFYASIPRSASAARIEAAFAEAFGVPIDAVLDDYAASPPRSTREVCLRPAECAAPPVSDEPASLACGVGLHPFDQLFPDLRALVRSAPINEGQGLRLRGEGFPVVGGRLVSCDGAFDPPLEFRSLTDFQAFEVWANPPPGGAYVMLWESPDPDEPPGGAPIGALVGARPMVGAPGVCEPVGVRALPADTREITVLGDLDWPTAASLGGDVYRMVFPFTLAEDDYAEVVVRLAEPPLEGDVAYLCTGGCPEAPEAECASFDLDPAVPYVPFLVPLEAGATHYVVVDGPRNPRGFELGIRLSGGG